MFEDSSFWDLLENFDWKEGNLVKAATSILDINFHGINCEKDDSLNGQTDCALPFGRSKLFPVPIKQTKILVEGEGIDGKNIIEIVFDIKDTPLDFLPGDTIGILPENSKEDVNTIIAILGLEQVSDKFYNISIKPQVADKRAKIPSHIPQNSTLRTVLKNCVDFTFPPKKQFFRMLYDYSTDKNDRRILGALCARDSKVFNAAIKYRFNLIKALNFFTSCRPPLIFLIEHLPRLLPRPYSISNSPLVNRNEIKITFSVLNSSPGQTTKMLEDLAYKFVEKPPHQQICVNLYLREHNYFRYTEEELSKNIIMISVGCAISPFIGFMQHKSELCNSHRKSLVPGKAWLFKGFRHPNAIVYKEEIKEFYDNGTINKIFESFSRDPSSKNKYVQECILENSEEFVNLLLDTNTLVYVCADGVNISKSIQGTIETCISKTTNCDLEEAKKIVAAFKKESKYREDIWI